MKKEFKKLVNERRMIKNKIISFWRKELKLLINNKKSDEEVLNAMSEMIESTDDVLELLKMFVQMVKPGEYSKIKKQLAKRLFNAAQNSFLNIESEDMALATKLFKEVGDKEMERKVKEFHDLAYGIVEDLLPQLEKYS